MALLCNTQPWLRRYLQQSLKTPSNPPSLHACYLQVITTPTSRRQLKVYDGHLTIDAILTLSAANDLDQDPDDLGVTTRNIVGHTIAPVRALVLPDASVTPPKAILILQQVRVFTHQASNRPAGYLPPAERNADVLCALRSTVGKKLANFSTLSVLKRRGDMVQVAARNGEAEKMLAEDNVEVDGLPPQGLMNDVAGFAEAEEEEQEEEVELISVGKERVEDLGDVELNFEARVTQELVDEPLPHTQHFTEEEDDLGKMAGNIEIDVNTHTAVPASKRGGTKAASSSMDVDKNPEVAKSDGDGPEQQDDNDVKVVKSTEQENAAESKSDERAADVSKGDKGKKNDTDKSDDVTDPDEKKEGMQKEGNGEGEGSENAKGSAESRKTPIPANEDSKGPTAAGDVKSGDKTVEVPGEDPKEPKGSKQDPSAEKNDKDSAAEKDIGKSSEDADAHGAEEGAVKSPAEDSNSKREIPGPTSKSESQKSKTDVEEKQKEDKEQGKIDHETVKGKEKDSADKGGTEVAETQAPDTQEDEVIDLIDSQEPPSNQPSESQPLTQRDTDTMDVDSQPPTTPLPITPLPQTPMPETPMPDTPDAETPGPETQAPETQAPETQAPETSAAETPAPQEEAPTIPPGSDPAGEDEIKPVSKPSKGKRKVAALLHNDEVQRTQQMSSSTEDEHMAAMQKLEDELQTLRKFRRAVEKNPIGFVLMPDAFLPPLHTESKRKKARLTMRNFPPPDLSKLQKKPLVTEVPDSAPL